MTEEVIKRGKPASFWIVLTSVFWIMFFLICNTVIVLLAMNDRDIQTVFAEKFNNQLGLEIAQQKSESELTLEEENTKYKQQLQECQIELEVCKRVQDNTVLEPTPTFTLTPTTDILQIKVNDTEEIE
jgi:hypothetical protein